jgi:hypothetical protein
LRSLWEPAVESIEHSSTLCRGRRQSGLRRLGGAANTRGMQPYAEA